MTPEELKRHMPYPKLLDAFAELQQDVDGLAANDKLFADLLKQTAAAMLESAQATRTALADLNQRVNDLTAQLASHESAPYPHVRYDLQAIGEIVLCGLDTPDYDPRDQTDAPDAFERLSAADSAGGA